MHLHSELMIAQEPTASCIRQTPEHSVSHGMSGNAVGPGVHVGFGVCVGMNVCVGVAGGNDDEDDDPHPAITAMTRATIR